MNEEIKEEKKNNKSKLFKSKGEMIVIIILVVLFLSFVSGIFLSPDMYWVTTAKYTEWKDSDKKDVITAMGEDNTEERFRLYFQYYNVLHELGHGIIRYNSYPSLSVADEEQLVNDFAVAYWNYYGEPEKMEELNDIVTYAVENVGDNYEKGVDYLEFARNHSTHDRFDDDFFTFNDYGWFQFSSVKHSIEQNKSLEDVLKEMGITNFRLGKKTVLRHEMTDETESTAIINEAVENFNDWGLYFPQTHQSFSDDPNMNVSRPFKNFFGIFNLNLF